MKVMTTIYADEGKILTDGEIYGTTISLANGLSEADFYEITTAEYEKIMAKELEENVTIDN